MREPDVDDFDRLHSRLRLLGTLVTRTALHVGASKGGHNDVVDLPVQKSALGFPIIPGSSLKGVVRSTIEGLVRAAGGDALWTCNPLDDEKSCGAQTERGADLDRHCAVCGLLGSRLVASHVRFSDARMTDEGGLPPIEKRDGVSIDRDLRTAAPKRKYDLEVVSPGTAFSLEIFVQNPEPWRMGLLLAGLDQIADGFTAIGGFTSRGLGRVSIEWTSLTRVTAEQLLRGKPTEALDIEATFGDYRAALGRRMEGGS